MTETKETPTKNENDGENTGAPNLDKQLSVLSLKARGVDEDLVKDLKFAKWIVKCPCLIITIIFVLLMIAGFIDSTAFALSDGGDRGFFVESDDYTKNYDTLVLSLSVQDSDSSAVPVSPQTQQWFLWTIFLMFKLDNYKGDLNTADPSKTDYWILTPDNIDRIIKWENKVYEDQTWLNRFCLVSNTSSYSCNGALLSLARKSYDYFGKNTSNMTTAQIKEYVISLTKDSTMGTNYLGLLNQGFAETNQSYVYRSIFYSGLPYPNVTSLVNGSKTSIYKNKDDRIKDQDKKFIDWGTDFWKEVTVEPKGNLQDGNMKIITMIYSVYGDYFNVLLSESMGFILFAIVFVLFYMTVHLQSLFLSVISLFQILFSFPMAYFFYRFIFQITHYDTLSSLIIFVLLGVGADDIFVFTDSWHQSVHFIPDPSNLELRMTFAYRRASKAMLVTQLTTFFAFLATSFSPLMPISAFGIWSATIIACNYILVITFYPCLLIIHHKYIKNCERRFCCCCCDKKKDTAPDTSNSEVQMTDRKPNNSTDMEQQAKDVTALSVEKASEGYRWIERFLGNTWSKFINRFKIPILIFFVILLGFGIFASLQIAAQDENEKWFPDDHFMQMADDRLQDFNKNEEDGLVRIDILFGTKGLDRSGFSRWDTEKYGKVIFDDNLDLSTPEAQQYMYDVCNNVSSNTDMVRQSPGSVKCAINGFRNYVTTSSFPYTYAATSSTGYSAATQKQMFAQKMHEYLTNSTQGKKDTADQLVYVVKNSDNTYTIRFFQMQTITPFGFNDKSSLMRDLRTKWDDYVKNTFTNNANCPVGLKSAFQTTLRWVWLVTQRAFVTSAIQGILIAMPLAFIILIIATRNYIISIFAVLDIIGVMLCELGLIAAFGWKFGISESVAIVIIIGFSVDYVVHLANAYLESMSPNRMARLSFSLLTIGVSVVAGAITTFGAGFFLVFPQIVFFQKMGILMMTTITISIFWAMTFFIALLAMWGPEGDTGKITKDKIIACFKCQKSE